MVNKGRVLSVEFVDRTFGAFGVRLRPDATGQEGPDNEQKLGLRSRPDREGPSLCHVPAIGHGRWTRPWT